MRILIVAIILALLIVSRFADAQLNHEYVPDVPGVEDNAAYTDVLKIVQSFMIEAGFGDKWWVLERIQLYPEGLVAFIMVEGQFRYALFIVDSKIIGAQQLELDDPDEECSEGVEIQWKPFI